MGFFFQEERVPIPIKAKTAAAARKQILAGATGCENCALQAVWARVATAKMPMAGDQRRGDILVLGAGPDAEEDRAGEAFAGGDGKLLRKVIPGRDMGRLLFQHMTRCHGGTDANGYSKLPSPQEVHACSEHLAADVAAAPIKAVLGLGQVVLNRFFPGAQLQHVHGTRMPIRIGSAVVWFYPVFDPILLRIQAGPKRAPDDGQAWPVFRADVRNFFAQVDRWPTPRIDEGLVPKDILLPPTLADAEECLDAMEGPVAIDLETSGLRPYDKGSRIYCGSISDGNISMAFPVDHPDARTEWGLPLLLRVARERRWIAHQVQFEYAWLKFFATLRGEVFEPALMEDTMGLGRIFHERSSILSLEDMSQIHLGVNTKWIMNINTKRLLEYPVIDIMQYCGLDTLACARIFRKLRNRVHEDNYRRLVDASRTVADMAIAGLDGDPAVSAELKLYWEAKEQEARETAASLYEVRMFERERGKFNISSAADVGIALVEYGKLALPKTKGKGEQYSTADDVLEAAAPDGHPLIDAVLAQRSASLMVSTFIGPFIEAAELSYDGRIHPGYTTMHTRTFRLSSEDPNIQNFPSRNAEQKKLRQQVVARAGHLLVKFDYKALEARIIGMASKDRLLCSSFLTGEDIHAKWRDKSLEIYPEYLERLAEKSGQTEHKLILKAGRDIIKTDFVFASFFGSTADSCAKRTGMPLHYMQDLAAEFWSEFTGVKAWIKQRRQEYKDTGSARLLNGAVRHGIMGGNEPINTPIQGSGAVIVVEAMNAIADLARKLKEPYLHPRINIHDDLTFELPEDPDHCKQYIDLIVPELIKVRFDWQVVPLAVEGAIGQSWASMEEFCSFTGEYIR